MLNRKKLITILLYSPTRQKDLATELQEKVVDVEEGLCHLRRSLYNQPSAYRNGSLQQVRF